MASKRIKSIPGWMKEYNFTTFTNNEQTRNTKNKICENFPEEISTKRNKKIISKITNQPEKDEDFEIKNAVIKKSSKYDDLNCKKEEICDLKAKKSTKSDTDSTISSESNISYKIKKVSSNTIIKKRVGRPPKKLSNSNIEISNELIKNVKNIGKNNDHESNSKTEKSQLESLDISTHSLGKKVNNENETVGVNILKLPTSRENTIKSINNSSKNIEKKSEIEESVTPLKKVLSRGRPKSKNKDRETDTIISSLNGSRQIDSIKNTTLSGGTLKRGRPRLKPTNLEITNDSNCLSPNQNTKKDTFPNQGSSNKMGGWFNSENIPGSDKIEDVPPIRTSSGRIVKKVAQIDLSFLSNNSSSSSEDDKCNNNTKKRWSCKNKDSDFKVLDDEFNEDNQNDDDDDDYSTGDDYDDNEKTSAKRKKKKVPTATLR